ncbi:hypothetical protein [Tanticharoenia sakaeratensis]|jgi:hypothetical protein|uniref:hypothetical protein n=1 Tax=Tanticharoenia sakaeratensis TaxID=444053 RepID=UPI000AA3E68C|nr:hypothetical protein [Tanticharoenia sakaeratensis]
MNRAVGLLAATSLLVLAACTQASDPPVAASPAMAGRPADTATAPGGPGPGVGQGGVGSGMP